MAEILHTLHREKLYADIWAESVKNVAKRYNISDVGLRKICKKLSIPMPARGQWAKVQSGQKIFTPPLQGFSGPTSIQLCRNMNAATSPQPMEPEAPEVTKQKQFERDPVNRIVVVTELTKPHPLVAVTLRAFKIAEQQSAKKHRQVYPYHNPYSHINLQQDGRGLEGLPRAVGIDIRTSRQNRSRALHILDALFRAFDTRNFPIAIDQKGEKGTFVTVVGEEFSIRLVERVTRRLRELSPEESKRKDIDISLSRPRREFVHTLTNELSFGLVLEGRSGFQGLAGDTTTLRLEDRLNEIALQLVREAYERKRVRAERERQEQERRRAAERGEQLQAQRRQERDRFRGVERQAQQWRRAERIRAYAAAVEDSALSKGASIEPSSELGTWLAWARGRADWLDPLTRQPWPLLDGTPIGNELLAGSSPAQPNETHGVQHWHSWPNTRWRY